MLKRMKNSLSIILIVSLILSCFTGCGAKNEAYRTIAVSEANGTTNITRSEKETFDAYKGVHLLSGDDAKVNASADMTLELDNDKHVYAEEKTHFFLTADGEENSTKTVINLAEGSVLVSIDNKLGAEESFEVDTPNSTMSVRGTVFRVSVEIIGGKVFTTVQTFEGSVEVTSKYEEKGKAVEPFMVSKGEEVIIVSEDNAVEISEKTSISFDKLPATTRAKLTAYEPAETEAEETVTETSEPLPAPANYEEAMLQWEKITEYNIEYMAGVTLNERGLKVRHGDDSFYNEYEYNDDNALIYEATYENYTGTLVCSEYTKYDDEGKKIERSSRNGMKSIYSYYPDGTIKEIEGLANLALLYPDDNLADEWIHSGSVEYNEHGDIVLDEGYDSIYGLRYNMFYYSYEYTYEYDAEGKMVSKQDGYYSYAYEYDDNGNLIKVTALELATGGPAPAGNGTYTYELINGKYLETSAHTNEYDGLILYYDSTTSYDENGRVIEKSETYEYRDEDGTVYADEGFSVYNRYEYDDFGNVTLEYEQRSGSEGGETFTYDTTRTYSYDISAFPAGKKGDLFSRTVTTTSDYYTDTDVEVYRYIG